MPKPTLRALRRHPKAIVLLSFKPEFDLEKVVPEEMDFEWFDNESAMSDYLKVAQEWNIQDVEENGDLVYLTAEIKDTKSDPIEIGEILVAPKDHGDLIHLKVKVQSDPEILVAAQQVAQTAEEKAAKAVKARKPASKGVATKTEGVSKATPKPKAKAVRATKSSPNAEADKPKATPKPKAKASELKARIAAKQKAEQELAALDAATAGA